MASKLKRVSEETERKIADLAEKEGRTFVAQLDRVVEAGLAASVTPTPARRTPRTKAPTKPTAAK